jgi:hypothetical protein
MKSQRRLQKILAGISLIILSLGFSFLGLLSFLNKPHADLANVPCVDSASWIAGTSASLVVGMTFLVASYVYWRRYPGVSPHGSTEAALDTEREPRPVSKMEITVGVIL